MHMDGEECSESLAADSISAPSEMGNCGMGLFPAQSLRQVTQILEDKSLSIWISLWSERGNAK